MPRSEEKEMFKDFMEEYNTASLPHKKYYDLEVYEKQQAAKAARKGASARDDGVRSAGAATAGPHGRGGQGPQGAACRGVLMRGLCERLTDLLSNWLPANGWLPAGGAHGV
jgi:hypothetical protein